MEEAIGEKKERDGDGGYTADEGVCMCGGGGTYCYYILDRKSTRLNSSHSH